MLLFQVEISIAFSFSQEPVATPSSVYLVVMETMLYSRTQSKGNKALGSNINKGII